jgi:putative ABC transport system permease protein
MRTEDIVQETYSALTANKARSGLTILGIVIGIASVIAMISIGEGAAGSIESSIQGLGSNLLTITPGAAQGERGFASQGRGSAQSLTRDDADALWGISGIAYVSPESQQRYQVISQTGNNTNTTVVGASAAYASVHDSAIEYGSFITDQHNRSVSRVAVLGPTVAEDLFGDEDPIGKRVRINNVNFKVIGIMQEKGGSGFSNPDDTVFIPLITMQRILVGTDYVSAIAVSVKNQELMPQVQAEINSMLIARHRVDPENPDFSILSQADILGSLNQITSTLTIFLAAVAGISLVVGGIGIMNMMLTTVTERTREIGLRKAIGAKSKDISTQFLVESIMLTIIGGVVGFGLGWGIAIVVSQFAGLQTVISLQSVLLAFGVSGAIGVVFGYYPARRAARLNPIEALRYE